MLPIHILLCQCVPIAVINSSAELSGNMSCAVLACFAPLFPPCIMTLAYEADLEVAKLPASL